jgi:DsbC/DsbD-like thiol-disulfide interchange protein
MIRQALRTAAIAATLAGSLLPAGAAADQAFTAADVVNGEIRLGWRTAEGTQMAALHLRLRDGWKTYWRAPGETGIPPSFDWAGSQNITAVRLHWPRPIVFEQLGARSIGYAQELVLPMEFTLGDPSRPAHVALRVDLGVCETICLPATLELRGEFNTLGGHDPLIAAALEDRPIAARSAGLSDVDCAVEPISDGLRLTARLDMPPVGPDEIAVIELADSNVWVSGSQSRREGGRLIASAEMVPPSGAPFALDRSDIRITIIGDDRAAELRGCPSG